MEKNASAEKGESIIICPSLVLTSSIRVSGSVRRFMKKLSAVLGAPILHRGKSNLDEVAFFVKRGGFKSFVVIYSRKESPSLLRFYKLQKEGYFDEFGCIVLREVVYGGKMGVFVGCRLTRIGVSEMSRRLWNFLYNLFHKDSCRGYRGRICEALIKDNGDGVVLEFWYQKKLLLKMIVRRVILRGAK